MTRKPVPLLWQGAFRDASGYSEESRCLLYACDAQARQIAAREWPTWPAVVQLGSARKSIIDRALARPEPPVPYVEVLHKTIPPASRAVLFPDTGPTVLRTMFETDSLPPGWGEQVARFDSVWVPSEFNLASFVQGGVPPEKLRVFPETLDFDALGEDVEPLLLPGEARGTRFLSVFEFTERKGWRILIDAWADAFARTDDVSLVIKCSGLVMRVADARERIDAHVGHRRTAPIVVIADHLSAGQMAGLYRACDAFVLPSRGEGWGRPLMEAMACGLPTIGPRWGGSLAYMSPANSFLVDGDVVPVNAGELVFERYVGQNWFDPDREEVARALRVVAAGGGEVAARGARGARDVRSGFSHERTVRRLEDLVRSSLEAAAA